MLLMFLARTLTCATHQTLDVFPTNTPCCMLLLLMLLLLSSPQYLLTGESAGGMMVHAILCQSRVIPGLVDAAIDMLGGVGADYVRGPKCGSHKPIPFLKLHGIEDPFITYSKDILVDGVNFASSIEGTQVRGCVGHEGWTVFVFVA